jgi:CheY-like chemotaxis protein
MVYLPSVEKPESLPDEIALAPDPAGKAESRTILLVDDDSDVRAVTLQMLESIGHKVIQAKSGVEALEKINQSIDVVITDYAMPGMTGAELATLIHEKHPMMPVLFVTGYADTDVLGLKDSLVVQKPFSESHLRSKLQKVLHNTRRQDGSD